MIGRWWCFGIFFSLNVFVFVILWLTFHLLTMFSLWMLTKLSLAKALVGKLNAINFLCHLNLFLLSYKQFEQTLMRWIARVDWLKSRSLTRETFTFSIAFDAERRDVMKYFQILNDKTLRKINLWKYWNFIERLVSLVFKLNVKLNVLSILSLSYSTNKRVRGYMLE